MKKKGRLVQIEAANPTVDIDPCLGKTRYATKPEWSDRRAGTHYPCGFCQGWHPSIHGFKGSRKGR